MIGPNYISYKDNAARVILKDGLYFRLIFNEYKKEYDHLMQSGLYSQLQAKGLMLAHTEIPINLVIDSAQSTKLYKLIKPEQIPFQSYPFEWSYLQWRKAILAYCSINIISLEYGMILKDATPFNFFMKEGNAVMLDTSSFEFFNEGDKWKAYRQFCSEFLSPLTLMHYNGQRWSRITRTHLRGLPLNFVSKQLPIKSWFNLNTLLHIHLHSKYSNGHGEESRKKASAGFSVQKLRTLLGMIQSNIQGWGSPYQFEKHWSLYYEKNIQSENYLRHKELIISEWLEKLKPYSVLDLGANTGRFSFIAAKYANRVIALEPDDICVDIIEQQIKAEKAIGVNAVLMDLVETTSNLGVLSKEFSSIYTRANSEIVMALALVHHLHISNQLSFLQIAEILSKFCTKFLIAEFIPITDSKVQLLIRNKPVSLIDYNEELFLESLSKWFDIKENITLQNSERRLFLLEKK